MYPLANRKKIRLKALALIAQAYRGQGIQKERKELQGGAAGKGQRPVLEHIQCHPELDHKK